MAEMLARSLGSAVNSKLPLPLGCLSRKFNWLMVLNWEWRIAFRLGRCVHVVPPQNYCPLCSLPGTLETLIYSSCYSDQDWDSGDVRCPGWDHANTRSRFGLVYHHQPRCRCGFRAGQDQLLQRLCSNCEWHPHSPQFHSQQQFKPTGCT